MKRAKSEAIYSPTMERALAGCAVMDAGVTTLDVRPEHFYLQDCGTLWRLARDMYAVGEAVDFATIVDEIERRGLDIPASFIAGLENEVGSVVHAPTYAQRVREDAHRRQSERFAQRLVKMAYTANGTYGDDLFQLTQQMTAHAERLRPAVAAEDDQPATWADLPAILGPIEWDWAGWLVRGMLAELVASSGFGKSNLALRAAGTYICGWSWPDGSPYRGELGSVLWCEAEAAQKLNLDRAVAWGIPLAKLITPLQNPLDEVDLFSAAHRAAIAARAGRPEVKLIVVDSLSGASAGRERGEDQMPIVKFFAELARDTNKPVLLLHHLRKRSLVDGSGDVVTLDMVRGATQITQMARVIWALDAPNGNDAEHKRLHIIKNNLERFAEPLGPTDHGQGSGIRRRADSPRTDTPLNRAIDLLRSLLEHGPLAVTKIEEEAAGAAISMSAMRDAKEALHALALRKGKGQGSYWIWSLPAILPAGSDEAD